MRRRVDEHGCRRVVGRALGLVLAAGVLTAGLAAEAFPGDLTAVARRRGWGYLLDKLVADGVPAARAAAALTDPRLPPFDGLSFSIAPRAAAGPYRRLQSAASVAAARRCRARYAAEFEAAEAAHAVPAELIAAIIHVESACGRNTGASRVFHRLARLAMANEPANLARNVRRHAARGAPDPTLPARVRARGRYLEDVFYPEVRALFTVGVDLGIDPLALRGSVAGAFGYPQFLPTSFLNHGVDANGDGRVDLYDMADAASSCARYLRDHGWRPELSLAERRAVIWKYNRSDVYIDTILALAGRLAAGDRVARERR